MRISILTIGAIASIIAINSVLADTTSTVTSRGYVDAAVATKQNKIDATGANFTNGSVVETTGINKPKNELIDEAKMMVKYMMDKRGVEIKELIVESSTTTVENIASVVASVVYLNEDILEE